MAAQPQAGWRADRRRAGRIDRAMNVAIAKESEILNRGAVPGDHRFDRAVHRAVRHGLGDQGSFEEIAISQNTSLAVVAPGIAEALLATGSVWSRLFRRWCSTTSFRRTATGSSGRL
jgi:hypothetical protein